MQSVFLHQCPVCAGALSFSSSQSNIIICQSCGSTINRNADGSLVHKPQFIVIENPGFIQPGTTGRSSGNEFKVLGRFRAWFEESVFSFWTIQFTDGDWAWLAEGYGIFSILRPARDIRAITDAGIRNANVSSSKEIDSGGKYILEKKYKAWKWEAEGEFYIPDNQAGSFDLLEYAQQSGRNISFFAFGEQNISAYDVKFVTLDELGLSALRDGLYQGRKFQCSNCREGITVKAYPYAQSCGCPSCGSRYSLQEGLQFRKEQSTASKEKIVIPLGRTGVIKGILYEVVGYALKEERNQYHSKWREYTLYNPTYGFAYLSEYDGHWIYVRERPDSPVLMNLNDRTFTYDKEPFLLFNSYEYKILDARGEFPYNIFDNSDTKVKEFISPPEVWIRESDKKEGITWYLGVHISFRDIKKAFEGVNLPLKRGIGAVQPTGYINRVRMLAAVFIAALILIFLHLAIGSSREERLLFYTTIPFGDSSNTGSFVSEKFTLEKWRANVCLSLQAAVSNSWCEMAVTLVNSRTGKEYNLEKGVEYYDGVSEGEYWSEGSTSGTAYFTRIPAGTYFFQITGTRDGTAIRPIPDFYVEARYDVPTHRNLWWTLGLLMVWPAVRLLYSSTRERMRWSNSPYSSFEN